jgi:FtsP/CotA-like multicopper oxidase with cupredoxin domain
MRSIFKYIIAVQFVALAFVTASAQLPDCPLRPTAGSVVQDPPSLTSQNGALQLAFTMRSGVDTSGFTHYCFDYATANGDIESPTLRLNPGDNLTIDLTNALHVTASALDISKTAAMMKDMGAMASMPSTDPCHGQVVNINSTNIHFHGLNIPPICHQDDVINTLIQAGTPAFRYKIQIPANEPPGLYWYHPHTHGFATIQVNGGASGALIVGGIEKIKPQVAGLTERVLIIRQQFINPGAWLPGPNQLTLNFQPALAPASPAPIIQMKPGEKQFWRVLNATHQGFVALQFLFGTTPQNMELISMDGVPVTGDPTVTNISLPPAARAEFIVQGPPAGTSASLVTAGFETGSVGNTNVAQTYASIVTTADGAAHASVVPVPAVSSAPAAAQRFAGLATVKATTERNLYFSEAAEGTNGPVGFFLTVAGQTPKLFKMGESPAIVTKVGAVEDWTIENHSSEQHAFHMHQIHFLVMEINGAPLQTPVMQDTVNMDFWNGKLPYPSVKVRMDFRDPEIAGTFVFHCHVLFHEDGGMMQKIRVDP